MPEKDTDMSPVMELGPVYKGLLEEIRRKLNRLHAELSTTPTHPEGPWSCRVAEAAALLSFLEDLPREVLDRGVMR